MWDSGTDHTTAGGGCTKKDPETSAVVITSPTYEGLSLILEGIAKVAHVHGIPLIVDSAHGAHLGFGGISAKCGKARSRRRDREPA